MNTLMEPPSCCVLSATRFFSASVAEHLPHLSSVSSLTGTARVLRLSACPIIPVATVCQVIDVRAAFPLSPTLQERE